VKPEADITAPHHVTRWTNPPAAFDSSHDLPTDQALNHEIAKLSTKRKTTSVMFIVPLLA
jgi:hypothetical protein